MAEPVMTQYFVSDVVKEYLIRATWNPLEGIASFTAVFLLLSVVLGILVRLSSLFVRSKITFMHAYTVIVWASAPFVVLSPLGMSLFKILQTPFYALPTFLICFAFFAWVSLRILKGVSVIFEMSAVKTYIAGVVIAAAFVTAAVAYYDSEFSLTSYMQFLYHIMSGSA